MNSKTARIIRQVCIKSFGGAVPDKTIPMETARGTVRVANPEYQRFRYLYRQFKKQHTRLKWTGRVSKTSNLGTMRRMIQHPLADFG